MLMKCHPTAMKFRNPPVHILLAMLLVAICWYWAECLGKPVPAESLDGAYQSFDAVQLSRLGHSLVHETPPYLGLGVSGVVIAASKIFGSTVGEVALATYFLCALFFALAFLILARLTGLEFRAAAMVAVLALSASWIPSGLRALALPATSLLGVRAFLPYLTVAVFAWLLDCSAVKPDRSLRTAVVVGLVAGPQILWSNDFGIPSLFALLAAYFVFLGWGRGTLPRLSVVLAATAVGAIVSICVVSGGHDIWDWAHYNFTGVALNQFWVFPPWRVDGPLHLARIYGLWDLLAVFFLPRQVDGRSLIFLAQRILFLIGFIGVARLRQPSFRLRRLALIYIGTTLLGAGYVSQIGGHVQDRYLLPLLPYALVTCGMLVARAARRWFLPISEWANTFGGKMPRGTGVAFGFLVVLSMNAFALHREAARSLKSVDLFPVPELGGMLPKLNQPAVSFARALSAEGPKFGHKKTELVMSTYYSFVDAVAGAEPRTPFAAIIHALGPEQSAKYQAGLQNFDGVVTTINPTFAAWSWFNNLYEWWPIHRFLIENFAPVARSDQHIFWARRAEGKRYDGRRLDCFVSAKSAQAARITIPVLDSTDHDVYMVEVSMAYHVRFGPSPRWQLIGSRAMILGDMVGTTARDQKGSQSRIPKDLGDGADMSIPYYGSQWSFPVHHRASESSSVDLHAEGPDVAFEVFRCDATVVARSPLDDLASIPDLSTLDPVALARTIVTRPRIFSSR